MTNIVSTMAITSPTARPIHWGWLFSFALLVTLLLCYIDEGRYTLSGLGEPGNIVAMSLYLLGLLLGLFGMNVLLARRRPGGGRTALVLLLGSITGVALTILLIYCMRGFSLPS